MTLFNWQRGKPAKTHLPFGLTKHQINLLRELRSTKGYEIVVGLLQDISEFNGDRLLDHTDAGDIRERQGYIKALRDTTNLIPSILDRTEQLEDNERRAESQSAGPDADAFIGTRFYDRVRSWATED